MWGTLISGWTLIFAVVLSGLAGYLQWVWWIPLVGGILTALVRDGVTGFHLTQNAGAGFIIRSMIMAVLMLEIVWAIGYGLASLF